MVLIEVRLNQFGRVPVIWLSGRELPAYQYCSSGSGMIRTATPVQRDKTIQGGSH